VKYLHLAGITLAGTSGSFNPTRHLLAAFLDGQGVDALRRTLQHEAFHQFAFEAIGPNLPVWLSEGLAQVFEEGIWTGNGFLLGQVPPRRLRELHKQIQDAALIDFGQLLRMTPMEWASGWHDPTISGRRYNQAWAMTQFLVYSTDERGEIKYRARLIEMLKLLRLGMDGEAAFRVAFSGNIDGFRDRFLEYAQELQPTAQATLIENQATLADMIVGAAQKGRMFSSLDDLRTAATQERWRIEYHCGGLRWESAADPAVYFQSLEGAPLYDEQLHFELAAGRPLPDVVCACDGLKLRTRFSDGDGKTEHETIVEWGN